MKTYKHKTLWVIATENKYDNIHKNIKTYWYKIKNAGFYIPEECLIGSQDREEVLENDWIDKVIDDIKNNDIVTEDENEIRKILKWIIEKHCPKQKMFTEKEVEEEFILNERRYTDIICSFLLKHWLLLQNK